jgi:RNA polymerase sigma factor (TIGR02999 family)
VEHDCTGILTSIERGDPGATGALLALVYDELRALAARKLAHEKPGQTLQPTALVNEAYLRLVGQGGEAVHWQGRGHFFAAAAEAMRRILVENARRKNRLKHGGANQRVELDDEALALPEPREDLLALDEALTGLQSVDAEAARLVQLRYFAGLTLVEAAAILGTSARSTDRLWAFAKAWLHREIERGCDRP